MDDAQIKHMVGRFLGWKLPTNFNPDDGITFNKIANKGTAYEYPRAPSGTNLLDYTQAEAMVRYMLDELPPTSGERDAPSGYVLVSVEPTGEMLRAGMDDLGWWVEPAENGSISTEAAATINAQQIEAIASCYRAMLAALRMKGK